MYKCSRCGGTFSSRLNKCPHCGVNVYYGSGSGSSYSDSLLSSYQLDDITSKYPKWRGYCFFFSLMGAIALGYILNSYIATIIYFVVMFGLSLLVYLKELATSRPQYSFYGGETKYLKDYARTGNFAGFVGVISIILVIIAFVNFIF